MLNDCIRHTVHYGLISGLLLFSGAVRASGLQVSPISLTLQARQNASGLTLSNSGNNVVNAQVRVYHWSQNNMRDELESSRGLLASPPMIRLNPGEQQLIRIIRTKTQSQDIAAAEDAFRLLINELPVKSDDKKTGLQFVLSYSLPVFVQPKGTKKIGPKLQWSAQTQPNTDQIKLKVSNSGNGHAQLAALSFVDNNNNLTEINKGLLGYVLPGSTMHWVLKISPATLKKGGKFKVLMNGTQTIPNITLENFTH
ncbi:molecular chaperone [Psychrobacter sp. Ps6]|nr:molecular chaperone [Psychrobacter sp. Ps6]